MKTRLILLLLLLVAAFVQPMDLIAQSRRSGGAQSLPPVKVDPAWRDFVDGTLNGRGSKQSSGSSHQQMPVQPKPSNPITKKFLGCTFRVTTMEEAVQLFSNNHYRGQVGERDILVYDVKFADRDFPFSQFVFNNDKLCAVYFISVYAHKKQALDRRASLRKSLSKKYNLVEQSIDGYKCYFAGDNNDRIVALTVQVVDDNNSETGKVYCVYLQYVDTKQAGAINDDL